MSPIDFSRFVHELATLSGQVILPFFRSTFSIQDKSRGGAFDPVTEADRAGEAVMRQLIKRTFPTHGIVGEEFGAERRTPSTSGFSTRSTGPAPSWRDCRCGAR